jgi:hypothetical protein
MSPKVVNGSFAAIIEPDEFLAQAYAGIRIAVSSLYQRSMIMFYNLKMTIRFINILWPCRITTLRQCDDEFVGF